MVLTNRGNWYRCLHSTCGSAVSLDNDTPYADGRDKCAGSDEALRTLGRGFSEYITGGILRVRQFLHFFLLLHYYYFYYFIKSINNIRERFGITFIIKIVLIFERNTLRGKEFTNTYRCFIFNKTLIKPNGKVIDHPG